MTGTMTGLTIRHFDIPHGDNTAWYGLPRVFGYPPMVRAQLEREAAGARDRGRISEREAEVDLFLSVLATMENHVTLVEAGAGWGEWCLALAGSIRNKLANDNPITFRCIGVEANPFHVANMEKNFLAIDSGDGECRAVWAALSDHVGEGVFDAGEISAQHCGGNLSYSSFSGSRLKGVLWSTYHRMTGKTVKVPVTTLDRLVAERIDILHVDVQSAEVNVIRGARNLLEAGWIDYMMIGTHHERFNRELRNMLTGYELLVDLLPGQVSKPDGLPSVVIAKGQDGLQLYRRRGL